MGSVQDRWYTGRGDEKTPTPMHGKGLRFKAHYLDPGGRQRSKSFRRKIDADRYVIEMESSKLESRYVDPAHGKVTVGKLADDWLAVKADIRASTRARYESALETHIRPRWGTTPVSLITTDALQRWIAEDLLPTQKPASVQKIVRTLSGILTKAQRDRRIVDNPAHALRLPKPGPSGRRYLDMATVETMADAAFQLRGLPARAVVRVFAYCGPRPGELAGFRVKHVDVDRLRLEVTETITNVGGRLVAGPPKDYERRSIPVPSLVMADLERLIRWRDPEDLLFEGERGGAWRASTARRAWFDDAATKAGVEKLVPYELRHTAASLAVSAGANVLAVSRMLGHADPSVTLRIYADLFDKDLDDVGKRLNDQLIAWSLPGVPPGDTADS